MPLVQTDQQKPVNRLQGREPFVAAVVIAGLLLVYLLSVGLIATANPHAASGMVCGLIFAIAGGVRRSSIASAPGHQIEDLLWPACIVAGLMVVGAAVAYVALSTGHLDIAMPMIVAVALSSLVFMVCARMPDLR